MAVGVPDSPPCPYPWMQELAKESLERLLLKGEINHFYNMWSDNAKKCMQFLDFGRMIAQTIQMHGQFTAIGEPNTPVLRQGTDDFWLMQVPMFIGDVEFFARISLNGKKQIGDFQYARMCKYHTPEYIKEDRIERVVLSEDDPLTIYTKPKGADTVPIVTIVHENPQLDVDMRMGYTFIAKDFEYLACAGVGVLRSEYTQEQVDTCDPVIPFTSKCIEAMMGREECGGVFLILIGYTALFIERIAKKFPGSIDGFILVNPAWYAPPESPLITLEVENVPTDVPILVLAGGKDLQLKPVEFEKWKEAVAKMPNVETVFYDQCDHFMVGCKHNPIPQEYAIFERHVSDVPLRKMAQFIRQIYAK